MASARPYRIGAFWGSHEASDLARLANRHIPELERYDARGERIDQVNFHPRLSSLMRHSMLAGLHCSDLGPRRRGRRGCATASGRCGST
jgi:putative acyl-CoA dehydrogenase